MRVTDQAISDFLATLKLGIEWIGDAGKKLVAIIDRNPQAYDDILEQSTCTWLTGEVLKTIEAIGRGQIAPEMLVLPLHVLNRLSVLPTDEQIKAMQSVEVAIPSRARNGGWRKIDKPACKLSMREARRAIGPNGVRSVEEQIGRYSKKCESNFGKYHIVMENGQSPRLERVINDSVPDYQKQRVKLINGCALIELYA